jgi:hypothetical protein
MVCDAALSSLVAAAVRDALASAFAPTFDLRSGVFFSTCSAPAGEAIAIKTESTNAHFAVITATYTS